MTAVSHADLVSHTASVVLCTPAAQNPFSLSDRLPANCLISVQCIQDISRYRSITVRLGFQTRSLSMDEIEKHEQSLMELLQVAVVVKCPPKL